ncbi:MAG: NeuD/PglB/VioB family sugar acetyltransferase [Alphaproteobacteria bacterium]|nr:NeuD/PglB/VioB family sugar acetyltransferase [Alphaproteobacteria bacterium]
MILGIYGSGGQGRDVFDLAKAVNKESKRWDDFVFINDFSDGKLVRGKEVLTFSDFKSRFSKDAAEIVIAVGEPASREILWNKVVQNGYSFATVIHPTLDLPETVKIGKGVTIQKNAFISCNVQIGDNVCIQVMACVGHDTVIGRNTVLSSLSNCAGNCRIGDNVYIALNVSIREHITVGNDTIVGMGAVVVSDLPSDVIAIGNPARPISKNEQRRVFKWRQEKDFDRTVPLSETATI